MPDAGRVRPCVNAHPTRVTESNGPWRERGAGAELIRSLPPTDPAAQVDRLIKETQALNAGRHTDDLAALRLDWDNRWAQNHPFGFLRLHGTRPAATAASDPAPLVHLPGSERLSTPVPTEVVGACPWHRIGPLHRPAAIRLPRAPWTLLSVA
nr:hypothetical protein [Streptomyces asoensis]